MLHLRVTFTHSLMPRAQRKVTMKHFSMAVGAAIALAGVTAPAQAQAVSSLTGTVTSTSSIDESILSNQMGGMKVTMNFDGGVSLFGFWADLTGGRWGVDLYNGNTRLGTVSLGATSYTYSSDYKIELYQYSPNLASILFEGGAAYGGVLFDRSSGFAGNSVGTVGSDVGNDYDLLDSDWDNVTAQYRNAVKLNSNSPVGDIFQSVFVDFSNATFDCGRRCTDTDAPDKGNSPFYFEMDTDKGVFAGANIQTTVPEPSTYALMGAGLMGIFGFARRRNRNA